MPLPTSAHPMRSVPTRRHCFGDPAVSARRRRVRRRHGRASGSADRRGRCRRSPPGACRCSGFVSECRSCFTEARSLGFVPASDSSRGSASSAGPGAGSARHAGSQCGLAHAPPAGRRSVSRRSGARHHGVFVHSYAVEPENPGDVAATIDFNGRDVVAAILPRKHSWLSVSSGEKRRGRYGADPAVSWIFSAN